MITIVKHFTIIILLLLLTKLSIAQTGMALSLDGINDYMEVVDHDDLDIDIGESFTITLWIKTTANDVYYRILSKRIAGNGAGYEMITQSGVGAYGMNLRSTENTNSGPPFGTTSITDGNWHHLAMVVNADNSSASIFVDGNMEQMSNVSAIGTESFANNVSLLFGTNIGQSNFMNTLLDDVRLWKAALSSTEITADMTATISGNEPDLIAAWDFENIDADGIVHDLTGNHDGQLLGQDINEPDTSLVVYYKHPKNLQLFPRDVNDEADIEITGKVKAPDMDSVIFELYRNDVLLERKANVLNYSDDEAAFSNTFTISAELALYDIYVHLDSQNVVQQISEAQDLVAGDAYIVQGQSNAWAIDYDNVANWDSPYLRTLGRTAWYNQPTPTNANDSTWYVAQGHTQNAAAAIGVYGLELGRLLIENHSIPVAIFNGSGGGGDITVYLRNDANPMDINTAYGRLLYRVEKAELTGNIKAITWNQGENESTWTQYEGQFGDMYDDLLEDYPNVENFYTFQIPPGCSNAAEAGRVREVQRHLPENYDNMRIMSRCNLPGHEYDFCHYHFEGYQTMAWWIYRQMAEDFFDASFSVSTNPPNILQATYVDPNHEQIALFFDQPVEWNAEKEFNGTTYFLKDHIYLDGNFGMIDNGFVSGITVFLNLTSSLDMGHISYIPHKFYNGTNDTYEGPWITGENSIGALTFFEVPVDTSYLTATIEVTNLNSFEIFPNPIRDTVKIVLEIYMKSSVKASILDAKGKQIKILFDKESLAGSHHQSFDLKTLAPGVYFILLEIDGESIAKKVVVK